MEDKLNRLLQATSSLYELGQSEAEEIFELLEKKRGRSRKTKSDAD